MKYINNMKAGINHIKVLAIACLALSAMVSCSNDDEEEDLGNWTDRSVFDGSPRSGSAYFTIGNIGYCGVGFDGDDYLTSFWSYDMDGDYWSQKADFPGTARNAAVGFTI